MAVKATEVLHSLGTPSTSASQRPEVVASEIQLFAEARRLAAAHWRTPPDQRQGHTRNEYPRDAGRGPQAATSRVGPPPVARVPAEGLSGAARRPAHRCH